MAEALYRKYRPQVFADVVGQDHIVRTLQNAINQEKVSHAYLFCGPRGTGKTTMARLLSKAMLCHEGPTPNPDGTCEDCRLIAEGTHPDVYELDAASRTGVENVREEIIGRVQFSPTRGQSKIYIIDEVHMLSTQAFNALLKTLEEPPSHVIFVLCTTDPQKVPETIHSRCQRFDFRRIGQDEMVAKLGAVCVAEGATFEGEALELVAHRADGGMRNALTALEQLIAFSGGNVTMSAAEDMLGSLNVSDVASIVTSIGKRDAAACFAWVAHYVETGGDLAQFARDLAEHLRNMYVMSLAGSDVSLSVSAAVRTQMSEAMQWFGSDRLARALCILGDLMAELKTSTNARLSFEIACIRLTRPETDLTLESLAERVERLEREGVVLGSQEGKSSGQEAAQQQKFPVQGAQTKTDAQPQIEAQAQIGMQAQRDATMQASAQAQKAAQAQSGERTQAGARAQAGARVQAGGQAQADAQVRVDEQAQSGMQAQAGGQVQPAAQSHSDEQAQSGAQGVSADNAWAKAADNPAALQRLWQQVLNTMKRDRGPHAVLFMNTRVAYDVARNVVNIIFAQGNQFAFKTAQKPEVGQSLQSACQTALGEAIPFAFMREGDSAAQPAQQQASQAARGRASQSQDGATVQARMQQNQKQSQSQPQQDQRQAQRQQNQGQNQSQQGQRQAQPQRTQRATQTQPAQSGQRRAQMSTPEEAFDEVPLELYDNMAYSSYDEPDSYESYAQGSSSTTGAKAQQNQGFGSTAGSSAQRGQSFGSGANAKDVRKQESGSSASAMGARKQEPNPEADAAWQGNLENAFGAVSVEKL